MKIDIENMIKTKEDLRKRDWNEKGAQPEMVIDCFLSLGIDDDSICEKCSIYDSCKKYLFAFKKDDGVYRRILSS